MEQEVLALTNYTDSLTIYIPTDFTLPLSNFAICVSFLTCSLLYPTYSVMVPLFSLRTSHTNLILFLMPFGLALHVDHHEHFVMTQVKSTLLCVYYFRLDLIRLIYCHQNHRKYDKSGILANKNRIKFWFYFPLGSQVACMSWWEVITSDWCPQLVELESAKKIYQ